MNPETKKESMSMLDIIANTIKILQEQDEKLTVLCVKQEDIDAKMLEIDARLTALAAKVSDIESNILAYSHEHYSVSSYASLRGIRHLDIRRADLIDRLAAKLSREYDIEIGKVKDERFGAVNIYHLDVLNEAFAKHGVNK